MEQEKKAQRNLRLLLGLFVYGATTFVVLAALGFWWAAHSFNAPGPLSEPKTIVIERGAGLNAIAQMLAREDVIESPYVFIFGARVMGAQSDLKAGEYEFPAHISAKTAAHMLHDGDTVERRFTIPEGLTSHEIVQRLKSVEALSGEVGITPKEGTLLPNTYDYQNQEPREKVIARMADAMVAEIEKYCTLSELHPESIASFMDQNCERTGGAALPAPLKTVGDIITLASIIEKETAVPDERKRVAGVFINRLQKGIALQTDPTVIYAITKGKHKNDGKGPLGRRLLSKDLQVDSPYNTYKYPGLPPGPIANPGAASIEAALEPEVHDFIYFVADGTGGHVFSKTLAEHNANVAKWRKIRRNQ